MRVKEESEKAGLKLNIQKTKIVASSPITSWQIDGETVETVTDFILLGSKILADGDCSHQIETLTPWKKSYDKPSQHIKKQRHYFANKGLYSQSYGFFSSHVWMWELDHKEWWAESPLDCKEIKLVNPKGNQPWVFIGRTEAEAPVLCEKLIHWKISWCWERLRAGGEGSNRGWDVWMASPTQRTWVFGQTQGDS